MTLIELRGKLFNHHLNKPPDLNIDLAVSEFQDLSS